jgi:hypothetical protein
VEISVQNVEVNFGTAHFNSEENEIQRKNPIEKNVILIEESLILGHSGIALFTNYTPHNEPSTYKEFFMKILYQIFFSV